MFLIGNCHQGPFNVKWIGLDRFLVASAPFESLPPLNRIFRILKSITIWTVKLLQRDHKTFFLIEW